ncbi:MAG: hypothetical protein NTX17_06955 [Candidatus Eisenbacteria bacterium]|nr:hypothetical protein [Candidatus Eisenbacteria bacterium]
MSARFPRASRARIVCLLCMFLVTTCVVVVLEATEAADKTAGAGIRRAGEPELLLSRPRFIYSSLGNRDPFVSLIGGEFQGEGATGLVSVGDMELVGILWGSKEKLAMVEDSRGRGYALRVGDAVIGGVVTDITKDSLTISQTFYGETQTVVIRMKGKEGERNEK